MIRNIIWDVDGTLFDTYPAISKAFQLAVRELGGDASIERIMAAARQSLGYCVSTLASECSLLPEDLGKKFDDYYDQIPPEEQHPFAGVIKICQYICALGGKNLIVSHRESQGVVELLAAHGMTAYFAGWIGGDDGYPKKPHPAAFEATIKNHGLNINETITVGDREIDILAGQAAGIITCLFDGEGRETAADLSITDFDELYAYLLGR